MRSFQKKIIIIIIILLLFYYYFIIILLLLLLKVFMEGSFSADLQVTLHLNAKYII